LQFLRRYSLTAVVKDRIMVDTASLIEQLVTVELSIAHEPPPVLRAMLRDVQFAVAELQKERLEMLRELERLRRRSTDPRRSELLKILRGEKAGTASAEASKQTY
jgi:hypothetical protein